MSSPFFALISVFVSLCLTPLVRAICVARGWYDRSSERKIHKGKIPRLGGVAIFWAFVISMAIGLLLRDEIGSSLIESGLSSVLIAAVLVHCAGLVDDFKPVSAMVKFLVQISAAALVIVNGFYFRFISFPFFDAPIPLGWLSYPLTLLWIVGITNAINMIDGMDGLAGGVSLIASAAYGIIYTGIARENFALYAFCLAGALIGYLFFNFPPARIFMGDSGAYFIGFSLSILPLMHRGQEPIRLGFFSAVTVLLVPILDVFAAILRRKREGRPVMSADRSHLHHKLLDLGLTPRQILAVIFALCLFLGVTAIAAVQLRYRVAFWIMIGAWTVIAVLFVVLHYMTRRGKRIAIGGAERT